MNWIFLKSWIEQTDPEYFRKRSWGVPERELDAYLQTHNLSLPGAYTDFLKIMGKDDKFNAFCLGSDPIHDFATLIQKIPPPDSHLFSYPTDRFFRTAMETTNDLDNPTDLYISLEEKGSYDVALYEYETYNQFDENRMRKRILSLMECFTAQVVKKFAKLEKYVLIHQKKDMILDFLYQKGYSAVFPSQTNVEYLSDGQNAFLLEVDDQDEEWKMVIVHLEKGTDTIESELKILQDKE